MRVILLISLLIIQGYSVWAQCPPTPQPDLDYAGYREIFVDHFNYNPSTFKTDPVFLSKWDLTTSSICDGWGTETYDPAQITMPISGRIRLTENTIQPYTCTRWNTPNVPIDHISGRLYSKSPHFANIGIVEAKIKIPDDSFLAWPAFWLPWQRLDPNNTGEIRAYTEIDILDNSNGADYGVQTNIFFDHRWHPNQPVQETTQFTHLNLNCHTTTDLSNGFHVYSCLWTPSRVTFYLDRKYIYHFDYDQNTHKTRTYPDFHNILVTLQTKSHTLNGAEMDIEYVRYLTQDCDADNFVIDPANTHPNLMTYPYLPPDFNKNPQFNILKHKNIMIGYNAPTIVEAQNDIATVLEAQSTIILPNFVANQSNPTWGTVSTRSGPHVVPLNGYFEIRSEFCPEPTGEEDPDEDDPPNYKPGRQTKVNRTEEFPNLKKQHTGSIIRIYPNPTTGAFHIEIPQRGNYTLRVMNMLGSTVYEGNMADEQKKSIQLDNNLPPGNYTLHISGDGLRHVERITLTK